jgi:hypothetical protein
METVNLSICKRPNAYNFRFYGQTKGPMLRNLGIVGNQKAQCLGLRMILGNSKMTEGPMLRARPKTKKALPEGKAKGLTERPGERL